MKNSFIQNIILNEVSGYYNKMLINEAMDMRKVYKAFRNKMAENQVGEEEIKNFIEAVDPEFRVNQAPDGRVFGEVASDYGVWALNRFFDGNMTMDDCESVREALATYSENKGNTLPGDDDILSQAHPIKNITSKEELFELVDSINDEDGDDNIEQEQQEEFVPTHPATIEAVKDHPGDEEKVFENNDWLVKVPLTHKGARILSGDEFGRNSGWCTAYLLSNYYDTYLNRAPGSKYYIIFSKRAQGEMWQFHPETNQLFWLYDKAATFGTQNEHDLGNFGDVRPLINFFKNEGKDLSGQTGGRKWLEGVSMVDINEIPQLLQRGESLENIFDSVNQIPGTQMFAVCFNKTRFNIVKDKRLLFPGWLKYVKPIFNGISVVEDYIKEKKTLVDANGNLMFGQEGPKSWLDYVGSPSSNCICVGKRTNAGIKYNYVKPDDSLLLQQPLRYWFDDAPDFNYNIAIVSINDKYNIINSDGQTITGSNINDLNFDEWFDGIGDFDRHGYVIVAKQDKYNYISRSGEYLWERNVDEWFDIIDNIVNDYVIVGYDTQNGEKLNVLFLDKTLLRPTDINDWFDDVSVENKYGFPVIYKGTKYFVDREGEFYNTSGEHVNADSNIQQLAESYKNNKTIEDRIYENVQRKIKNLFL